YQPLPSKIFPAAETAAAFRYMAARKNIGKVVVSLAPEDRPTPSTLEGKTSERQFTIRSDAAYLVTGGLGALGMRLARWLVDSGAKHLVLVSRRAPSSDQQRQIEELSQHDPSPGARVLCLQADVADLDS